MALCFAKKSRLKKLSTFAGLCVGSSHMGLWVLYASSQKLVFLIPIFGNVDGSCRVPSKLRGFTLIQVARRRSKVFQKFPASLVQVGVVKGVPR